ncbi:hypothetical protein RFI_27435 [Reticulomyxa filosa]|uniref:Uncharacterized protein n=1 Tax=Reticulomyxa filosa TaxID=46433 RepID=X6M901_RETFI|nr:hypothetical protein RFI_27435 [Reticulomyxa filosa]|eukprot:ETO09942.1 hypothetical protein RFI_27435 [Reticulomyxa filosa]
MRKENNHTLLHHVYELMISNKMNATNMYNLFIRYNAIYCKQKIKVTMIYYLMTLKSITLVREMHQYGVNLNCDIFNNLIRHCYEDDNDFLDYITEQLHVMMDNYNISPKDIYLLLLEHNHVKVAERIIDELSDKKSLILKLVLIYLQIFEAHDGSSELIQQKLYPLCEAIPQRHHSPSASFVYDDIRKCMSCGIQLNEQTIRQWLITDHPFTAENSTINNFIHYFNHSLHRITFKVFDAFANAQIKIFSMHKNFLLYCFSINMIDINFCLHFYKSPSNLNHFFYKISNFYCLFPIVRFLRIEEPNIVMREKIS